jgi:lipopolysaccharide assembly protein A
MRLLTWLIRLALFVVLLGFALSNTETASLRFFGIPEFVWRAPLVLFLLIFFAAGAVVGVLSSVPVVFRQRRQIARLRREAARSLADSQQAAAAAAAAPVSAVPVGGSGGVPAVVHESGIRGI